MVRQKPTFIFSDQDCRLPSWLFLIFVQRSTFSLWGFSPPKKRGIEIHAETSNKILGSLWPPAQSEKSPKYYRAPLIAGTAGIDCSICFAHFVIYPSIFFHLSIDSSWSVSQSMFQCVHQFICLLSIHPPSYPLIQCSVTESFNHFQSMYSSIPSSVNPAFNQSVK